LDKRNLTASMRGRTIHRPPDREATGTRPPLLTRSLAPGGSPPQRAAKAGTNDRQTIVASTIRSMEGEGNERKFTLSFSSEEPYERWYGLEILDHSPGAVDLTRLNEIGCLLFNHNRDKVIGKVNRAWLDGGRAYAEVEFDTDEASEVIFQKVRTGTLKGVSVGYRIDSLEEVMAGKTSADGRFTGPCDGASRRDGRRGP